MKLITFFFVLSALPNAIFSQVSIDSIYYNNVKVVVMANGRILPYNLTNPKAYVVPKDSGVSPLFYLGILWTATAANSNVGACINFPKPSSHPGPVSSIYTSNWYNSVNDVYKVKKSDVVYHQNNWYNFNYTAPTSIITWPAMGNINEGTGQYLASFYDFDANNSYIYYWGDYPQIRGDIAAYNIFNYDSTASTIDKEYPLEVHQMTYQIASNDARNNTTYLHYRIINRGADTLKDFRWGLFLDYDLGGAIDDYIGTDSARNLFYVYNGDNYDGNFSGAYGYGNNPPAFGCKLLNKIIVATNNLLLSPNPWQYSSYYNLTHGLESIGLPQTNSNGDTVTMIYKGDPNIPGSETEFTVNNNPGDRRGVIIASPISIPPDGQACYTFALIYARGTSNLNSVTKLQQTADFIQNKFNQANWTCWQPPSTMVMAVKKQTLQNVHIYPNPCKLYFHLKANKNIRTISLINSLGQLIMHKTIHRKSVAVNTASFPNGIYIIQIQLENGKLLHKKLMINR